MSNEDELELVAKDAASAMGWELSHTSRGIYLLDGPRRIRLSLNGGYGSNARIIITGEPPVTRDGRSMRMRGQKPEISVALSRGAFAVVEAISKRMLAGYDSWIKQAESWISEESEKVGPLMDALVAIRDATGGELDGDTVTGHIGGAPFEAEMYPSSGIYLRMEDLSAEQALEAVQRLLTLPTVSNTIKEQEA